MERTAISSGVPDQWCRTRPSIEEANHAAAEDGYERLEFLLWKCPEAAEDYIRSVGYGKEWAEHKKRYAREAVSAFLAWVRKDMGLE